MCPHKATRLVLVAPEVPAEERRVEVQAEVVANHAEAEEVEEAEESESVPRVSGEVEEEEAVELHLV